MLEEKIDLLIEAINNLTAAVSGRVGVNEEAPKLKAALKLKAAPATADELDAARAAAGAAAARATDLTIDEVRARLGVVIQSDGPSKVQAALTDLGVSKLTDLPAAKYGEILEMVGA